MLRSCVSRLTTVPTTRIVSKRNSSVLVGPATKHISPLEKYTLASIMMVGLLAYPVYMMSNIKRYKAKKE